MEKVRIYISYSAVPVIIVESNIVIRKYNLIKIHIQMKFNIYIIQKYFSCNIFHQIFNKNTNLV